jgi:hypothetical protein
MKFIDRAKLTGRTMLQTTARYIKELVEVRTVDGFNYLPADLPVADLVHTRAAIPAGAVAPGAHKLDEDGNVRLTRTRWTTLTSDVVIEDRVLPAGSQVSLVKRLWTLRPAIWAVVPPKE